MNHAQPAERIASLAVEAILHEAVAGPKPGLVDRYNNGAHKDMDLFTFTSSASVLHPFFSAMAETGSRFENKNLTKLLGEIRPIGIEAEKAMFKATGGINTHKGLIFSLGILSASTGHFLTHDKSPLDGKCLCDKASQMCLNIVEKELSRSAKIDTNGEKLFKKSGITGIRGEAERGFPSVLNCGLPTLRNSSGAWNNRLIETLLKLMTVVEDSNVLHRGDTAALIRMRKQATEALEYGGAFSTDGMEILKQMDMDFTERHISPGGCADLLAVTIFLYNLENEKYLPHLLDQPCQ